MSLWVTSLHSVCFISHGPLFSLAKNQEEEEGRQMKFMMANFSVFAVHHKHLTSLKVLVTFRRDYTVQMKTSKKRRTGDEMLRCFNLKHFPTPNHFRLRPTKVSIKQERFRSVSNAKISLITHYSQWETRRSVYNQLMLLLKPTK